MNEPNFTADSNSGWIFNHLHSLLWQRRYIIAGATLVIFLAGLIGAYSLPTMYRSKATLLVQSQDLPSSIVESPVAGEVEQRIAKIRERVLSRGDLIALIEQKDLYPEKRRSEPLSTVVNEMREATMVGALAGNLGAGSRTDNTIAITMSFDYPDPGKAQAVLQDYVTNFMRIDSDDVEDQASLSVQFLSDQARKLQTQISQIEGEITSLKARNGSALATSGTPMIDTGSYSAQITNLENQNRLLLASARSSGGDPQIAAAEAALAAAQAQYSDSHPDVMQARERLRQLRQLPRTDSGAASFIEEQIKANNATIAALSQQRDSAIGRASAMMAGSARAPAILERAMQLESRASALREQHRGVATDLLRAQNSARMAGERRAERLSLVDAPDLPDTPHSPNRPLFIWGGLGAGLAVGLLLALIAEFMSRPLRSPLQIQAMGFPVLGLVPVLGPSTRSGVKSFFKRGARRFAWPVRQTS